MGTYVIEGVELDYKVKMVLGDHQQPPRSQKLTIMERLREYRAGPCVLSCNHVYHSCSIQNIHSIWLIMATVSSIQLLHASYIGTFPSSYVTRSHCAVCEWNIEILSLSLALLA